MIEHMFDQKASTLASRGALIHIDDSQNTEQNGPIATTRDAEAAPPTPPQPRDA
jgi:hypothetical protein